MMTDEPGTSHSAPSKPRTCRELEHALLTLGFSRREAKAITSHGFGGMAVTDPEEDLSGEIDQLVAALRGAKTESKT
ncbi:MAG: hypothetical protein ABI409_13200 [Ramlibacter sp.]